MLSSSVAFSTFLPPLPWSLVHLDPVYLVHTARRLLHLSSITWCILSCVQLFATPWTVAHQAPLSMRLFQARILERVAISFSRGSSLLGDRTCVFFVLHWNLVLAFLSASPA